MQVFISYSSADVEFASQLATKLQRDGLDVWYAEWEISVGDSIVSKINEGIHKSDCLVIVLSKTSLRSKWVQEELAAAFANLAKKEAHVLPVLLDDCEIPPILAHRKYANFKSDPERAYRVLLESLQKLATKKESERRAKSEAAEGILGAILHGLANRMDTQSPGEQIETINEAVAMLASLQEHYGMTPRLFRFFIERCLRERRFLTLPQALEVFRQPDVMDALKADEQLGAEAVRWVMNLAGGESSAS